MKSKSSNYVRQSTEVSFAQHSYEFVRFYSNHESLNVEIAGIRERRFYEKGKEKVMLIDKHNFWFGIKKLQAFAIDNLHYIKYSEAIKIQDELDELEDAYSNNEEYAKYTKRSGFNSEELLRYNLMYFKYLLRCFEISNKISSLMQNTLMIAPKMQKKEIMYRDDSPFFDNLSRFREGISNNLANFRMVTVLDHFKYVLSYYYTYSSLIDDEFKVAFKSIISNLEKEILSKETMGYLLDLNKGSLSPSKEREIKDYSRNIKKALQLFYYYCNVILREKNIFPNNLKKVSVDLIRNI